MADLISFYAYDELMNEDYFKQQGFDFVEKNTVTLSAYRLVFNKIPADNGGPEGLGHANIEPTPTNAGMMEGVMYEMSPDYLSKLDEYYGFPDEYTRQKMRFNRHDFTLTNGIIYTAQPGRVQKGLKPSKAMMKLFRAAKKNMTMLYFARLMTTPTVD